MSLIQEREKRVVTTHVGSLPRPDALNNLLVKKSDGAANAEALAKTIRDAVGSIIRQQVDAGVDIVDDGEQSKPGFVAYVTERLAGFEPRKDSHPKLLKTRENQTFPEFYECGHSGAVPPRMATTQAIRYVGQQQLRADIGNLKAALAGVETVDVFMPAASPSSVEGWQINNYYKNDEECVFALAEAMREEYEAIVNAGFLLQVDDPRLAMHYMLNPQKSIDDCRRWAALRVEALNHALRNVPSERVRHHTCYGINMGPLTNDIECKHIVDIVLSIKADYYSFEAANPRHEHEWRLWESIKLPPGKAIMPGVITHTSVIVEHPELIAERIVRYARLVGRQNVIASADCGFASTPREVPEVHPTIVWAKLRNLTEGARLASRELWPHR